MTALLESRDLTLRAGGRSLCEGLRWRAAAGQCWGVLGPNGAGKSTLLRTLAGLRPADGGTVLLDGRPVADWPRRDRARRLGMLLQESAPGLPAGVLETVLAGRHPHLGPWRWEGAEDLDIARRALAAMDLAGLEARALGTLSGGERQRVRIAALLAQDPPVTLLDEPLQHLDLRHQRALLELLRRRTRRPGHVVVMVLHDPNLARQACSHVLLLPGDGGSIQGAAEEVLTAATLSALYRCPLVEARALLPRLDTRPPPP